MNLENDIRRDVNQFELFKVPDYAFLPVPLYCISEHIKKRAHGQCKSILITGYGADTVAKELYLSSNMNVWSALIRPTDLYFHSANIFKKPYTECYLDIAYNRHKRFDIVVSLAQLSAHVHTRLISSLFCHLVEGPGTILIADWFLGAVPFEAPTVPLIEPTFGKLQFRAEEILIRLLHKYNMTVVEQVDITAPTRVHLAEEFNAIETDWRRGAAFCKPNFKRYGYSLTSALLWLQTRLNQGTLQTSLIEFKPRMLPKVGRAYDAALMSRIQF